MCEREIANLVDLIQGDHVEPESLLTKACAAECSDVCSFCWAARLSSASKVPSVPPAPLSDFLERFLGEPKTSPTVYTGRTASG